MKQKSFRQFRHNQAYLGVIQAYSGMLRTLCNPGIFRAVVYPEPRYIQKQKHIQNPGIYIRYNHNPGIFRTPVYSERWHIQNPRHIHNPVKDLR